MVITDDFVYIHIPKTGGTFVETALRSVMEADRVRRSGRKHGTVADIPEEHREKPVVTTVRNPYEHLVSHYEFGWWGTHPGDTFDEEKVRARYPHYPNISFHEYVEALHDSRVQDQTSPSRLEDTLQAADIGRRTIEYFRYLTRQPDEVVASLERLDVARALASATAGVRFLRSETLNRDLYELLVEVGHPPEAARLVLDMERIYPYPPTRKPSQKWQDYYSPRFKHLVRRREWAIFALFPEYDV